MPSLQQMAQKEGAFAGGHRMCAGCPVPIFTKMLTRVTDGYEIVAGNATGCLECRGLHERCRDHVPGLEKTR